MKTIAFFNNKGGVGKTTLVYHLAWMYSEIGVSVLAADFDPQANLSAYFLEEERLERLWPDGEAHLSVLGSVSPILRGLGDIREPHVERITNRLGLLVGDLGLSNFEKKLSAAWPDCMAGDESAFRAESAFHRLLRLAADKQNADLVLIDVGPNLGAINRAVLIAANHVVLPLAPDLFSIQALRNVGPVLEEWRRDWRDRLERAPAANNLDLPQGDMEPVGYIVMQHAVYANRPVKAYQEWANRIPGVYGEAVSSRSTGSVPPSDDDPECLARLKHYRSLMAMAHEARKPMFHLRAADGALGGHIYAVKDCYRDFENLARSIADRCGLKPADHGASKASLTTTRSAY